MSDATHPDTTFSPAQLDHARRTGRPASHDVADPTASGLHETPPAGVVDETSAVAHARSSGRAIRVPGHPEGHWARPDGSVGPHQAA